MVSHCLSGEIRDGKHILPVRVYYENTDFLVAYTYKLPAVHGTRAFGVPTLTRSQSGGLFD